MKRQAPKQIASAGEQTAYALAYVLQSYIAKHTEELGDDGWFLSTDPMSGTFYLNKGERVIMATPLWEEFESVPVDMSEPTQKHLADLPFIPTGDLETDRLAYVELMSNFLNNLK